LSIVVLLRANFGIPYTSFSSPQPAGNVFQGTLFFYKFRGLLGMEFMNAMNYTAANLGIREFDAGVDDLAAAIDGAFKRSDTLMLNCFSSLTVLLVFPAAHFPVLSANLNLTLEAKLSSRVLPFTILNITGEKVGVIGYMSPLLKSEGSPGTTVDVIDPVTIVRSTVEILQSEYDVTAIICLSSNDEFTDDVKLASQVSGVDIIIGYAFAAFSSRYFRF
jgi:2',3'-cyclic-nucleotide 2'-phosphodiesterase (5'-nucleotidase family)